MLASDTDALLQQTANEVSNAIWNGIAQLGYHYVTKDGFDWRVQFAQGRYDDKHIYIPVNVRELPTKVDIDGLTDEKTLRHLGMVCGFPVRAARLDLYDAIRTFRANNGHGGNGRIRKGLTYIIDVVPDAPPSASDRRFKELDAFPWNTFPEKSGIWLPMGMNYPKGEPVYVRLDMLNRHLLIAGITQHGKSTWMQTALAVLASRYGPDKFRLMLMDAKFGQEFSMWDGLEHLVTPVCKSPEEALQAARLLSGEMARRGDIIARAKTQNFVNHNEWAKANRQPPLPLLLVMVDEFGSIMNNIGGNGSEFEHLMVDVAQKALATGIVMWCSCQVPTVKIIPSTIRANLRGHVVFAMDATTAPMSGIAQAATIKQVGRYYTDIVHPGTLEPDLMQGWWIRKTYLPKLANTLVRRSGNADGLQPLRLADEELRILRVGIEQLAMNMNVRGVMGIVGNASEPGGISQRRLQYDIYPRLAELGAIAKLADDGNSGWRVTKEGVELAEQETNARAERRKRGILGS
jgi:hypothetical protein